MPGNKILNVIRNAARDTTRQATDMVFGTVTRTNPLTVKIDNRLEISNPFLVTTSAVSDFNVDMILNGQTQTYTAKLGLKVGENVLLLRTQNGQRYIIIDRLR